MTCTNPLEAFLPLNFDERGKRKLIFSKNKIFEFKKRTVTTLCKYGLLTSLDEHNLDIFDDKHRFPEIYIDKRIEDNPDGYIIQVPCGKCLGCKLDYSRNWATRAVNEGYFYDYYRNCAFLSLTFNEKSLNNTYLGYSVDKAYFRSWIKRLRFAIKSVYNKEIRIMACGEYGSKHLRPHYHLLVFGFNFPDKKIFKYNKLENGKSYFYYRSKFLEKLWTLPHSSDSCGYSVIGDVNYETCAYVARYVLKKVNNVIDNDKQPEFLLTSRRPGLGYDYCVKFKDDIFNHGFVVLPNGFKSPVPRYYESICEKIDPVLLYNYKFEKFNSLLNRMYDNFKTSYNNDYKRYDVLSEINILKTDKLVRSYELDDLYNT